MKTLASTENWGTLKAIFDNHCFDLLHSAADEHVEDNINYYNLQINNKLDSVGLTLFNNIDCALMGYAILSHLSFEVHHLTCWYEYTFH